MQTPNEMEKSIIKSRNDRKEKIKIPGKITKSRLFGKNLQNLQPKITIKPEIPLPS